MTSTLRAASIPVGATIREAMLAINEAATEVAFLVDGDGRLLGTLSDGDIRRGLLAGKHLDDAAMSCMNRHFSSVGTDAKRSDVLDLMRARSLAQIPILDEAGRIVGLHLLREIIGSEERPNWAVMMAGGRGERLRPLTDSVPKPMLKVAGRPILERLILHYVGYGIRTIYLAVNYLNEIIQDHFGDGARFGCQIHYLLEPRALGTAGALSLLPSVPEHPLLVTNADLITDVDIGAILAHHDRQRARLTVGVREYRHTIPFGVIEESAGGVTALKEKPTFSCRVNTGMYVLDPDLLLRIRSNTEFTMPDLIDTCLTRGESVAAYSVMDEWLDVGRPADLQLARGAF